MTVKMIATDLDRTLLGPDKLISAYAADVLNRCRSRSIKVVFATARPKRTVSQFLDNVPADAVIIHNGAVIYVQDKVLHRCGILPEIQKHVLRTISSEYPDATLSVEIDDVLYANFDVSAFSHQTRAVRTDFTDLPDRPADKMIVGVSSLADIERYAKFLPEDLYIEMNDNRLGLIMHKDATKLAAVQWAAGYFGCDLRDVVAFGDDYNDAGMLRACGVGVAVANALDGTKSAADEICDSNDNDGVAKWIEEHIL